MSIKKIVFGFVILCLVSACTSQVVEKNPDEISDMGQSLEYLTQEQKSLNSYILGFEKIVTEIKKGMTTLSQIENKPDGFAGLSFFDSILEIGQSIRKGMPKAENGMIRKYGVVRNSSSLGCDKIATLAEYNVTSGELIYSLQFSSNADPRPILRVNRSGINGYQIEILMGNFPIYDGCNHATYQQALNGLCYLDLDESGAVSGFTCSHISTPRTGDVTPLRLEFDNFMYSRDGETQYGFFGSFFRNEYRILSFWADVDRAGKTTLQSYSVGE